MEPRDGGLRRLEQVHVVGVRRDGRVELAAGSGVCALGALGEDELGAGGGDQLTIVGELAPDSAIRAAPPHADDPSSERGEAFESAALAACKALVAARDRAEDKVPIAFKIESAFDDRLQISSRLVARPSGLDPRFQGDAELVNKCFGDLPLSYELRAGRGYVVVGRNLAGFVHRVQVEAGTGRCRQDPEQDARRTGRALENEPFDNGLVSFQIRGGGQPKLDTVLALGLLTNTSKAVTNASLSVNEQVIASLPLDLRWSDTDDMLYMVDVASRGLLQIPVDLFDPGGITRSFQ